MATTAENRARYEAFTAHVQGLCADRGVRRTLSLGRGRPVADCTTLHTHLSRATAGRGGRHAHYTVAALMALADPPTTGHPPRETPALGTHHRDPGSTGEWPAPVAWVPVAADPAREPQDRYNSATWRRRPNLGATLAAAVRRANYNEARTEDLLQVLAKIGDLDLHRRLPSVVERLLREGLVPDWPVLLEDLVQRGFQRNPVATRWLDSYYLALPDPRSTR